VLGSPAAALTARIAAAVLAIAVFAGAVRLLPILLAPSVPPGLAWPLGRGVALVGLEIALFVAPPLALALTAAGLVDRGEARALFALGVRPLTLALTATPTVGALALAAGLASHAVGLDAAAPGRLARSLLAQARATCVAEPAPAAAHVPLLGLTWVCLAGEPPRLVGALPMGGTPSSTTLAAATIALSDDLRTLQLGDAEVLTRLDAAVSAPGLGARVRVRSAMVRGLPAIGRASNLSPAARALVLGGTVLALAELAALVILARAIPSRVAAVALSAAGSAAALSLFSALERAHHATLAYAAVPALGMVAVVLAALPWWRTSPR
jgi:hypothetical protein